MCDIERGKISKKEAEIEAGMARFKALEESHAKVPHLACDSTFVRL